VAIAIFSPVFSPGGGDHDHVCHHYNDLAAAAAATIL
jgi:hypothetical protein